MWMKEVCLCAVVRKAGCWTSLADIVSE